MKTIITSIVVTALFNIIGFAQTTIDVIQLKNGQEISGTIIEQKPGHHIKIQRIPEMDTVLVNYSEIELILKRPISQQINEEQTNVQQASNNENVFEEQGKFNSNLYSLRLSTGACGGDYGRLSIGLGAYRRLLSKLNVGLHVQYFSDYVGNGNSRGPGMFFTTLLDTEYEFQKILQNRLAYLAAFSIGYLHTVKGQSTHTYSPGGTVYSYSDGFYFSPSLGFRVNVLKNAGFIFKVGYQGTVTNRIVYETGEPIKKLLHSNIVGSIALFF